MKTDREIVGTLLGFDDFVSILSNKVTGPLAPLPTLPALTWSSRTGPLSSHIAPRVHTTRPICQVNLPHD